jgi:TonB-linked SusC/RagA family outer membrane protein
LTLAPDAPAPLSADGKLNWQQGFANPFASLQQKYSGLINNLIGNAVLTYNLLPGLNIKANLGYTQTGINEANTIPLSSFNPADGATSGYAYFGTNNIHSWIAEPQLEYATNISKGKLKTLIGTSFNEQKRNTQVIAADNFSQDGLLNNPAAAASLRFLNSDNTVYRYNAVFLRINYDWMNKYLVNLTGRRDGSSRFGPGKKFANFGAVGLGWIFSKENYFKHLSFLSYGKLRGSFGITGNDQIGDYKYLSTWAPTIYPYQAGGLYPTNLLNPDYSWETNKKLEINIELGFIKDRILITGGYYNNKSTNQLVGYSLPLTTGFSSVQANLPAVVQNQGWEFEINTRNIEVKNFSWSTSFNISFPSNKLLSYPHLAASTYANTYMEGKSLFIQKLFQYAGVDPQTGIYQFQDVKNKTLTATPDYPADLLPLKSVSQDFYGGLQNSIIYKNWQFDLFFQFVKQTGFNYWYGSYNSPGMMGNQPIVVLDRWQKPGDNTTIQQYTQSYGSSAYSAYNIGGSDYSVSDASFIRLKNISISYTLPDKVKRVLHLNNASLFIKGQNLFTITNYLGLDPENQSTGHLPALRVFIAGFKITI